MLLFLSLLSFVVSQGDPTQGYNTKLGSCLFLIRSKLTDEGQEFEEFFSSFPKEIEDAVMNKAVGVMLESCVGTLSEEDALSIMMDFQTEQKIPSTTNLLPFNKEEFKERGDFELTPSQIKLFEDVKEAQARAQEKANSYNDYYAGEEEEAYVNREPLPLAHFGWGYILAIFGVFGAFFYMAIKKVLKQDAPKKTKKNKKSN